MNSGLAGPQAYAWGCLGGGVAAFVVYALPGLVNAHLTGHHEYTVAKVVIIVLLVVALAAIAGVVPLLASHVTRNEALEYGLASQTILKGVISGGLEALKPVPPA